MEKILVLSDIHFPLPISNRFLDIIDKEKPDKIILLGDNVDDYKTGMDLLETYKDFIEEYESIFPLNKTIMLIGDNDYQGRRDVLDYVKSLQKINGDSVFTYQYKNLFMFHGNIESSHWQELFGKYAGIMMSKVSDKMLPNMLAQRVVKKFNVPDDFIVLLGHIHYLGSVDNAVFCGTLNQQRIIYPRKLSMGYAVINSDGDNISESDIGLVQI